MTDWANLKFEIYRKFYHLVFGCASVLCIHYFYEISIVAFIALSLFSVILELLTYKSVYIKNLFYSCFATVLRPKEITNSFKLKSFHYFLFSFTLSLLLFKKDIAIISLSIMVFGDTFSAIIGKKFGSIELIDKKTVQGSFAFFVVSYLTTIIIASLLNYQISTAKVFSLIVCATIAELLSDRGIFDDNLVIPIVSGLFLEFIN